MTRFIDKLLIIILIVPAIIFAGGTMCLFYAMIGKDGTRRILITWLEDTE